LKLWLLDADIIIDFLSIDVFRKLTELHEIYVASSVIDEANFFKKGEEKIEVNFRGEFIETGLVKELSATLSDTKQLLSNLPPLMRETLHAGEIESLAILSRREDLTFCTCDAASIKILPLLNLSEAGISAEKLLETSGLSRSDLQPKHTEEYFKANLEIGQREKIYNF
jgi:hypothetical protein